jgi:hypothetical protein
VLLRWQRNGLRVQVQPLPLSCVAVSPEGNRSSTVTVPEVAVDPTFFTTMEYVAPVCPRVKLPLWLLVMSKSAVLPTVSVAEAVLPVPPLLDVTLPLVLFLTPAVVPVTFTETTQELLGATPPSLRL